MAWAPDYADDDALREFTRIPDDADAGQISLALSAASRAIDEHCRRQFGSDDAPVARYYTARWDSARGAWVVDIDDLMTGASALVDVDTGDGTFSGAVAPFTLAPRNAAADGMPWTMLVVPSSSGVQPCGARDEVRVTTRFGWQDTPDPVVQATLLQGSRFLSRRDSPYGIAGSPQAGSEMRLLDRIDPDVAVSLKKYRRKARPQ